MAKLADSPGAAELGRVAPVLRTIPSATRLARVYYTAGRHATTWNEFRHFGPLNVRWDHHAATAAGWPQSQVRGICYAARDAQTCFAESFQSTRRIDRAFQAPWLVVFETIAPLRVLDLTEELTRMGATAAIHSGSRRRARGWARDVYEAFGEMQGVQYPSPMNGGAAAFALNERALNTPLFAAHPLLHRALADDLMLDPLKHAAQALGYALR